MLLPPVVEVVDGTVAMAYVVGGSGCDGGCNVVLGQTGGVVEAVAQGKE